MDKNLQNYIEEEITTFNGQTFSSNEQAMEWLRQSLHRIAKITTEEIVPEKKESILTTQDLLSPIIVNPEKVREYYEAKSYNQALSDLQTKIKEFGI